MYLKQNINTWKYAKSSLEKRGKDRCTKISGENDDESRDLPSPRETNEQLYQLIACNRRTEKKKKRIKIILVAIETIGAIKIPYVFKEEEKTRKGHVRDKLRHDLTTSEIMEREYVTPRYKQSKIDLKLYMKERY